MSSPAAPEPQSQKKVDTLLQRAKTFAARALRNLFNVLTNVQDTFAASGATVVAGAAIVASQTATVQATGIFKVTAWFSGTAPAGTVRPLVSAGPGGGPLAVVVSGESDTTTQPKFACVHIFRSGLLPGATAGFSFTTTAGDQTVTLGGTGGVGAEMIVEEYPFWAGFKA